MHSLLNSLPDPASGVSFARTPSSSSGIATTPLTPVEIPGSITSDAAACRLPPRPGDTSRGTFAPSNACAYATHSVPSRPPPSGWLLRAAAAYGRMVVWSQATARVRALVASTPAGMPEPPLTRPAVSMAAALDMATMEGGWLQIVVASPLARTQTSISLQRRPAASAPPPTEADTTASIDQAAQAPDDPMLCCLRTPGRRRDMCPWSDTCPRRDMCLRRCQSTSPSRLGRGASSCAYLGPPVPGMPTPPASLGVEAFWPRGEAPVLHDELTGIQRVLHALYAAPEHLELAADVAADGRSALREALDPRLVCEHLVDVPHRCTYGWAGCELVSNDSKQ
eukprot:jgi/Ulvmu1/12713/UM095_0017.1